MILDALEAILWLIDTPRWVAQTLAGKLATVAVIIGLVLWLGVGLSAWFAGAPGIIFAVLFLTWEHRTTKASQRQRRAAQQRAAG